MHHCLPVPPAGMYMPRGSKLSLGSSGTVLHYTPAVAPSWIPQAPRIAAVGNRNTGSLYLPQVTARGVYVQWLLGEFISLLVSCANLEHTHHCYKSPLLRFCIWPKLPYSCAICKVKDQCRVADMLMYCCCYIAVRHESDLAPFIVMETFSPPFSQEAVHSVWMEEDQVSTRRVLNLLACSPV